MTAREAAGGPVGIVGDFDSRNPTHQATNEGLAHAGLRFEWVPTEEVLPARAPERLGAYAGLLIAPASPYVSMDGALAAIRFARERGVPLVGT
jgi:CTP synthase (UTP-ammonia lyase)